ncbi:hypothetical protein PSHT_15064 [Puccinia striiformis]|uniref:Uncharacterized protein n=1 Tax=Puccinia striiformis TaxID=27350 RepID=A0A2S4UHB8_9BASI|nr:hypothetical protein PSHT_15064 [Puccinia striiformis]
MVEHRRNAPDGKKSSSSEGLNGCAKIIDRYSMPGSRCLAPTRALIVRELSMSEIPQAVELPERETLVTNTDKDCFLCMIKCPVKAGLIKILQGTSKLRHLDTQELLLSTEPMRVAICGAGSAGFYSASRPFALDQQATCTGPIEISIDLSMRLPSSFVKVAEHPRFHYLGNTTVLGEDAEKFTSDHRASIRLKTSRSEYNVVFLSYGSAGKDTSLGGIPGEDNLSNILPGRAAVEWYNGYPTDPEFVDLTKTGLGENVLEMLDKRIGRLSERIEIRIDGELLVDAAERIAEPGALSRMANGRLSKRLLEVMLKASKRPSLPTGSRTHTLRFPRTPASFRGPSPSSTNTIAPTGPIKLIKWQINQLDYPLNHHPLSVDCSSVNSKPIFPLQFETTQSDLVMKSLGYQPIPFPPLTKR